MLDSQMSLGPIVKLKVDTAATADVIAAQGAGKKIRILAATLVAANTVTLTVKNGSTAVTGAISMAVAIPLELPYNPHGHFIESANEAFNFTLSSGVQLSGTLTYQVVG